MYSEAFPGLNVIIRANGSDLEEYQDEDNVSTQDAAFSAVERYVEAVNDANLSIELRMEQHFCYKEYDILMAVYIDGVKAASPMLHACPDKPLTKHVCEGVRRFDGSQWYLQKFCFAPIETSKFVTCVNILKETDNPGSGRTNGCRSPTEALQCRRHCSQSPTRQDRYEDGTS